MTPLDDSLTLDDDGYSVEVFETCPTCHGEALTCSTCWDEGIVPHDCEPMTGKGQG